MAVKKVFIETSVLIRFFIRDDETKFNDCLLLFKAVESGNLKPYSSNIVIFEIIHVLIKIYKFPKQEVLEDLQKLLNLRNLTLIEKTNTKKALALFKKCNIKYGDCLIASQIPEGVTIVSYDSDFNKISSLKTSSPELLNNLPD